MATPNRRYLLYRVTRAMTWGEVFDDPFQPEDVYLNVGDLVIGLELYDKGTLLYANPIGEHEDTETYLPTDALQRVPVWQEAPRLYPQEDDDEATE